LSLSLKIFVILNIIVKQRRNERVLKKIGQFLGFINRHKYEASEYNAERSCYNFRARNMLFSEVEGYFKEAEAKGVFDAYNLEYSYITVIWPVGGIKTGIVERDKQLIENSQFFFQEKFPKIIFRTTAIKAHKRKQVIISGVLKIKDIEKDISLLASYKEDNLGYIILIDYELDRFDFMVGESDSFAVGREIRLQLDIAFNY
jgi:polyisoprenoid-binding protein YceI